MPQIKKPMLAGNFDEAKAKFPYLASPKIDGIRFLMVNGVAVSRTFKPIRNKYIQSILSQTLSDGIDGELTVGNSFQSSTSGIMSIDGEPDFKVWLFDYVDVNQPDILPYYLRILNFPSIPNDERFTLLRGGVTNNQEDMNFLKNLLYQVKRNPYQEYSNSENENKMLLYQHLADRLFNFLMCQ